MLIDGHLRAETTKNAIDPVLVLDVTEAEADKLLLTLDPLAAMALADQERVLALPSRPYAPIARRSGALLERVAGQEAWQAVNSSHAIVDPPAPIDRAGELQAKWGTENGPARAGWPASDPVRRLPR